MPSFIAHLEFRFSADDIESAGRRLRELANVADSIGFEMGRGRVEPGPGTGYSETDDWSETEFGASASEPGE